MGDSKSFKRNALLAAVGAAGLVLVGGLMASPGRATADGASVQRVDDFRLADQDLLARHLYKLGDAKAVVLISYAAGDATVRADAPAYRALQAAYAPKGVEFMMLDSKLGEQRPAVRADAKAAGID